MTATDTNERVPGPLEADGAVAVFTPDDLRALYREARREAWRKAKRSARHRRRRNAILDHYGRACSCCGATQDLTVDHVNGGGNQHRAQLRESGCGGGYGLYRWLVVNGFPEGFQILCGACNRSKDDGESCRIDHTADATAIPDAVIRAAGRQAAAEAPPLVPGTPQWGRVAAIIAAIRNRMPSAGKESS